MSLAADSRALSTAHCISCENIRYTNRRVTYRSSQRDADNLAAQP
jgi:hypothetical protein